MPKYEICLAYNVACYANFTVDAEDEEAAIKQAAEEAQDTSFTVEWDTASSDTKPGESGYINESYRLVDIEEVD